MRQITAHRKSIESSIIKLKKQRDEIDVELAALLAMLEATEPKKRRARKAKRAKPRKKKPVARKTTRHHALRMLRRGDVRPGELQKKAGVSYNAAHQMLDHLVADGHATRKARGLYAESGN